MNKIAVWFEKVWDGLIWSSANPEKLSLTVKGFLTAVGTIVTIGAGLAHVVLPSDVLTTVSSDIVTLVQQALLVLSSFMIVIGGIRKIILSFKGQNASFTSP